MPLSAISRKVAYSPSSNQLINYIVRFLVTCSDDTDVTLCNISVECVVNPRDLFFFVGWGYLSSAYLSPILALCHSFRSSSMYWLFFLSEFCSAQASVCFQYCYTCFDVTFNYLYLYACMTVFMMCIFK